MTDVLLIPFLEVLYLLASLYISVIIVAVIFDWLKVFGILDSTNKYVFGISIVLRKLTEPAYRRIRRFVPLVGSIDFSPFVLVLLLFFLKEVIVRLVLKLS